MQTKLHLLYLKRKYDIVIIDYKPGMFVVSVGAWDTYEDIFIELIEELTVRQKLCTIDKVDHLLTIYFDEAKLRNEEMIQQLLQLMQSFDL